MQACRRQLAESRWIRRFIQLILIMVTLGALARHGWLAWSDAEAITLTPRWTWIVASAGLYAVGLAVLGLPWTMTLSEMSTTYLPRRQLLPIYLASHLGKYVPGKAMVFVIRMVGVRPLAVPLARVITSTFHETFLTMATGATIAAVVFGYSAAQGGETWRPHLGLAILAGGCAAGLTLVIWPPIFGRLLRLAGASISRLLARAPKQLPESSSATNGLAFSLSWSRFALEWWVALAAWSLQGLAYQASVAAVAPEIWTPDRWPILTASLGISVVLGFASAIPGQWFVRDWILLETLLPVVGYQRQAAIAGPVLFRLVTLGVELVVGGLCYLGRRR